MALIGLLVIPLAAGCGGSGVHAQTDPTPSPSITSPAVTPSSSPGAPTKAEQAGTAAVHQVIQYERLLSELAIHPHMSLDRLYTVSTQPDVTEEISSLNQFREARDRQMGLGRVVSTRVDRVSLTNRPQAHRPVFPTVQVTMCLDVRGVRGFGPSGKSIVPKSRKAYLLTHLVLVNTNYPNPTRWLVRKVSDEEKRTCHV